MEINDKVVVVTGGGSGIGRAMRERFARQGAAGIVVADLVGDHAGKVATAIGGAATTVDIAVEAEVQRLVADATRRFGRIDLFRSNAGVIVRADAPDAQWQRHWDVNVMAHVCAARAGLRNQVMRTGS